MKKILLILAAFFALTAFNLTVGPTVMQAQHLVLYGTEIDNDTLFAIDLINGVATVVGALVPPAQIEGLAFNPDSGNFYGVDNSNHTLIEISTDPLSWSVAHTLPYGTYSNLARNPITGIYYTHFNNTDTLSTVDPVTGAVVPVGASNGVFMQSLAFDSSSRLFGIGDIPAPGQDALYELNVSTGEILSNVEVTSNLANPAFNNSLAIHPETGVFYTVAAIEGGLYEIDPLTGAANRVGNTGLRNIRSLDFAVVDVVPHLGCMGFESPCDSTNVAFTVKKNKCIPLKTGLIDESGISITDADIEYPPVLVLVSFTGGAIPSDIATVDGLPPSQSTDGNQFEFIGGRWCFNLKIKDYYTAPGTYTFEMTSGDSEEYIIEPTCTVTIVVEK